MDFDFTCNQLDKIKGKLVDNTQKIEKDLQDERDIFQKFEESFSFFEQIEQSIRTSITNNSNDQQQKEQQQKTLEKQNQFFLQKVKELNVLLDQEKMNNDCLVERYTKQTSDMQKQIQENNINSQINENHLSQIIEDQQNLIESHKLKRLNDQNPQDNEDILRLKQTIAQLKNEVQKLQQQSKIDHSYFNTEKERQEIQLKKYQTQIQTMGEIHKQENQNFLNTRENLQNIIDKKQKKIQFLKEDESQLQLILQQTNEKLQKERDNLAKEISNFNVEQLQNKKLIDCLQQQLEYFQQKQSNIEDKKASEIKLKEQMKQSEEKYRNQIDSINNLCQTRLQLLEKQESDHAVKFQQFQTNQDLIIYQLSKKIENLTSIQAYFEDQYVPEYKVELKPSDNKDYKLRVQLFTYGDIDQCDSYVQLDQGVYYVYFSGYRKLREVNQYTVQDSRKQGFFKLKLRAIDQFNFETNEQICFCSSQPIIKFKVQKYFVLNFKVLKQKISNEQLQQAKQSHVSPNSDHLFQEIYSKTQNNQIVQKNKKDKQNQDVSNKEILTKQSFPLEGNFQYYQLNQSNYLPPYQVLKTVNKYLTVPSDYKQQQILQTNNLNEIQQKSSNQNDQKVYFNEDAYIGQIINNRKEGQGTMYYINGNVYIGQWKNDMKNGKGVMQYKNGDKYEGEWKYDQKHGMGILQFNNGDYFEGEFLYNQQSVLGQFYSQSSQEKK